MKKISAKAKKALDKIPSFSELLKVYNLGDCFEFVVNRWGDICTFRVYNNGEVVER